MKNPRFFLAQFTFVAFALISLSSCQTDNPVNEADQNLVSQYLDVDLNDLPNYENPDYPVHYDANIQNQDNSPNNNPTTNEGANLGRVLFYDQALSLNLNTSCASCHQQANGFTDPLQFSEGFDGGFTGAHSMRLANTNFYTGDAMFWDKRAATLEDQVIMPIQDAVEMGFDANVGGMDSLVRRLEGMEYYPILFKQAFGDEEINADRISRALAQFVRSMVSTNSKFDEGLAAVYNPQIPGGNAGANFSNFTAEENLGKQLFLLPPNQGGAGCAGCHAPPTFALTANSRSNGLEAGETTIFKSPSLKNIGYAGPYMHDGSLSTLAEVVEHYNSGIQDGPALDNRLGPGGQPQQLNLTQNEKDAIVAFLQTLDDPDIVQDPKFSDPFR
jgi:cytochrome c peroxidase